MILRQKQRAADMDAKRQAREDEADDESGEAQEQPSAFLPSLSAATVYAATADVSYLLTPMDTPATTTAATTASVESDSAGRDGPADTKR